MLRSSPLQPASETAAQTPGSLSLRHLIGGQLGLEHVAQIRILLLHGGDHGDLVADVGDLRFDVAFGCFEKTRGRIFQAVERGAHGFQKAAGGGGSQE